MSVCAGKGRVRGQTTPQLLLLPFAQKAAWIQKQGENPEGLSEEAAPCEMLPDCTGWPGGAHEMSDPAFVLIPLELS